MQQIDLNCDMGESYGAFTVGNDEGLMKHVSSVNIACGFHGGDPSVMRKTLSLAISHKLAAGAHPGYQDLEGFGRRDMKLSPPEIYEIVVYQIGALIGFAQASGTKLTHVKPHGALYNTAAKEPLVASAIANAVRDVDSGLLFYGLSGSHLISEGKKIGLRTVSEVFGDRTYQDDGSLTPRSVEGAMITDPNMAAHQVLQMIQKGKVTCLSGKEIQVVAETVCIHGDGAYALDFAIAISKMLTENGVKIKQP